MSRRRCLLPSHLGRNNRPYHAHYLPSLNGASRGPQRLLRQARLSRWLAGWNGFAKKLEFLLKAGADPKRQGILVNLPLKEGAAGTKKILLEAGADVMARYKYDDHTPLHAAIFADDAEEKVKILLDAGADIRAKDKYDITPWDNAQKNDLLKGTKGYWALSDAQYN